MAADFQSDPQDYLSQYLGVPVKVTSGDRTPEHNAAVGGVPNSAHLDPGYARDFIPQGMSTADAASRLAKTLPAYDQIIDEGDHVHVSLAPTNRRQFFAMGANTAPPPSTPDYFSGTLPDAKPTQAATVASPATTPDYFSSTLPATPTATPPQHAGWRANGTDVQWYDPRNPNAKEMTGADFVNAINPLSASNSTNPVGQLAQGAVQGGRDVISSLDPIAKAIESVTGPITLGGMLPTAGQATAANTTARNAFNASPAGQSIPGQLGRFGGQVAATVLALAAGGAILGPAVEGMGGAGEFLSGTGAYGSGGGANGLLRMLSGASRGAVQGAGTAGLTSSTSDQPIGQQLEGGAITGGALGGAMSGAGRLLGNVGEALRGGPVSPQRVALANTAAQYGINLRPSQISEHPFINYLDSNISKVPGSGLEADNEAQRAAFSGAVARTFGENGASGLTPELMTRAKQRIGDVFNKVAANTTLNAATLPASFADILNDASSVVTADEVAPLKNQIDNITTKIDPKSNTISGAAYQALTRKNAPLDRALNSNNSNIRFYGTQIKNVLDDALEGSAAPEDLSDLRTARLQYKNLMTVKDLAAKSNIEGEITPSALLGAVKKSYKDMAFSGAGDIGNLAHIGGDFLRPPPSSGSGERTMLYLALGGLGSAATESALTGSAWPLARDAGGLGATMGAARLIGHVLKNGPPSVSPAVAGAANRYGIPLTMLGANAITGR